MLRFIETPDGVLRGKDVRRPEQEKGVSARIELVCTIGGNLYAFEHTRIEPFPGQIKTGRTSRALFDPVKDRLAGKLPPNEYFELRVPLDSAVSLKPKQLNLIQDLLVSWIQVSALILPVAPYGRNILPASKNGLLGVPFEFSLHRYGDSGPMRGRLGVVHLLTGDDVALEKARADRIRISCEKKFGKLDEWKRKSGARSVLILENRDMQLTNHQVVGDALSMAEEGRVDRPDEVYLVETFNDPWWWVACLRRGDQKWDADEHQPLCLDATALIDLMKVQV